MDSYQVDIIYYHNPHMIWVEIDDPSVHNRKDYVLEQIGLYGVLPLEMKLDIANESIKSQRCEDWVPAATLAMKDIFQGAEMVEFCPIHVAKGNSVFDSAVQKYGEIIITSPSGEKEKLSTIFKKRGLLVEDETGFYLAMTSGRLKTKLNRIQTDEVLHHIDKFYLKKNYLKHEWEEAVHKQTSLSRVAQHLTLTEDNLITHNILTERNADNLLQQKFKYLKMYEDYGEEPVGRGISKSAVTPELSSSTSSDKLVALRAMKKHERVENSHHHAEGEKSQEKKRFTKFIDDFEEISVEQDSLKLKHSQLKCLRQIMQKHKVKDLKDTCEDKLQQSTIQNEMSKTSDMKSPNTINQFTHKNERCIAYGPPCSDRTKWSRKMISPEKFEKREAKSPVVKPEKSKDDICKNYDAFAELDSDTEEDTFKKIKKDPIKNRSDCIVSKPIKEDIKNDSNISSLNSTISDSREQSINPHNFSMNSLLLKKLSRFKEMQLKEQDISVTSKPTSAEETKMKTDDRKLESSDDESISDLAEKLKLEYPPIQVNQNSENRPPTIIYQGKNNVNPFKNINPELSVFVEKLITPILMVHSKINTRIQPSFQLRDIYFNYHIHMILKNMKVEQAMILQTVSWPSVLRGRSTFLISPKGSGKTLGYLPAVCRLISDADIDIISPGPLCIIVCATAASVANVENLSRMFIPKNKVLVCFSGMNELELTTSLLNGCDLLICTPTILVRLLQMTEFGVDLRRLTTFVLDDCERLAEVYMRDIKFFLAKIKAMLKCRVNKEVKVQIIVSSRIWCEFMENLAKKAPNTVVCFGAFQECVLYSKANTVASFVTQENKINAVLEFLEDIDQAKKTVIVCRKDEEVEQLEKVLLKEKYTVFACNSTMNVEELYTLNKDWSYLNIPGRILVCCDGNLTHMNVTDAHYLLHYSMPHLFSMFCKRFSVLNDNYASIFKEETANVKIKVLLEDTNVEQLPKILNFIKRCTDKIPQALDDICQKVLADKDVTKAKQMVPICDNMLSLGECPDFWNCQDRHSILKEFDQPKGWMPQCGVITFKILHYQSPVCYSARLLTNVSNGQTVKYPATFNILSMKISTYFSRESNKKLHGIPKVGDICAVSTNQNFFVRCQVVKILNHYERGNPNFVLIKLIEEEKLETTRDIYLYYLPDDMKHVETHVVQVRLAGIKPRDKDVTFSELAKEHLKKITDQEDDLYIRGNIMLTVGNCIIVDNVETCKELTLLNNVVVRHDFKEELLKSHAILNPDHMTKLEKLFSDANLTIKREIQEVQVQKVNKELPKPQWAHLEKDNLSCVFLAFAEDPSLFYMRLLKSKDCMDSLVKEIQKYANEVSDTLSDVTVGDIVLARLPDDGFYERARIDEIVADKIKCFFVDEGDWRTVTKEDLKPITEKFITQLPFQAIECRLVGVRPAGENWTEFSINWFLNCFEDDVGNFKQLFVKYYTKENSTHTGGHKYGVAIIDSNNQEDIVINQLMLDLNLARKKENEIGYLEELEYKKVFAQLDKTREKSDTESEIDSSDWEKVSQNSQSVANAANSLKALSSETAFEKMPIKSVPLIPSDEDAFLFDPDRWDICMSNDLLPLTQNNVLSLPPAANAKTSKSTGQHKSLDLESNTENIENPVRGKIPIMPRTDSDDSSQKSSSVDFQMVTTNTVLDSDDFSSSEVSKYPSEQSLPNLAIDKSLITEVELRKPKLVWHQNKKTVLVKIQLIGVEKYDVEIKERYIKFNAYANDTRYGFEFELYGVVDVKISSHANKGQYVLLRLRKILNKNWLTLTRDGGIKKWIVYDTDSLDVSSEEETIEDLKVANVVVQSDTESDEDFVDDVGFNYKR